MKFFKLTIALMLLMLVNTTLDAKLTPVEIPQQQQGKTTVEKLTFKEKVALKVLEKKVKKQQKKALQKPNRVKKAKRTNGFFGRLILGVVAILVGVLLLLGAVISVSFLKILLSVVLIVVGALLIISSIFEFI